MGAHNSPSDFGRYLQARRRAKGVSLEELSQHTRITTTNLQYIESEDLSNLPSPVFVKGFLRAYAGEVDADCDEVLNRYEARCRSQATWIADQSPPTNEHHYLVKVLAALLILALVVAGTLYVAQYKLHSKIPEQEILTKTSEPPADQSLQSQPSEVAEVESDIAPEQTSAPKTEDNRATTEPTQKAAPVKALQKLELQAIEPTWLKVISDGAAPMEFAMQTGERLSLEAEEDFSLLIGNAGGIRIVFNGEAVPVLGKSGQVVTLQLP
jgi:cytoskeletal protein RodZ